MLHDCVETKYFIVGARPVKSIKDAAGSLGFHAINWKTGRFELDMSYCGRVLWGEGDETREVGPYEFKWRVKEIRQGLLAKNKPEHRTWLKRCADSVRKCSGQ